MSLVALAGCTATLQATHVQHHTPWAHLGQQHLCRIPGHARPGQALHQQARRAGAAVHAVQRRLHGLAAPLQRGGGREAGQQRE